MDFDPAVISYEQLLQVFWDSHEPASPPYSNQYSSVIFYHNDAQKKAALESKDRWELQTGKKALTQIIPVAPFYPAEDYHQKYYLQQSWGLNKDAEKIKQVYGNWVDSTALARLNGYVGHYGTDESLKAQIDELGLSEEGKAELQQISEEGLVPGCKVKK